jgi:predicted GNAT family acetyltransferase
MAEASGGVTDNEAASRYELAVEGRTAFLDYAREGRRVVLLHTEVPPELEGRGHGTRLVRGALDQARASGEHVVPRCAFVKAFVKRHPDYADLVRDG